MVVGHAKGDCLLQHWAQTCGWGEEGRVRVQLGVGGRGGCSWVWEGGEGEGAVGCGREGRVRGAVGCGREGRVRVQLGVGGRGG